jgi:hypothetical protein
MFADTVGIVDIVSFSCIFIIDLEIVLLLLTPVRSGQCAHLLVAKAISYPITYIVE